MRLLPNQSQSTSGTHKPSWLIAVPDDPKPEFEKIVGYLSSDDVAGLDEERRRPI